MIDTEQLYEKYEKLLESLSGMTKEKFIEEMAWLQYDCINSGNDKLFDQWKANLIPTWEDENDTTFDLEMKQNEDL